MTGSLVKLSYMGRKSAWTAILHRKSFQGSRADATRILTQTGIITAADLACIMNRISESLIEWRQW